jgi:perosamine synthetase
MEQLPGFIDKKRALATRYKHAFENMEGVKFFCESPHVKSNYWLNVLLLDKADLDQRDKILEKTNDAGIMTRPAWILLNKLKMFQDSPVSDLSCAQDLEFRLMNIPSSVML